VSGTVPDVGDGLAREPLSMPSFLLHHRHAPGECRAAFAAWKGFDSPLRHGLAPSTCLAGGHAVWWQVDASDRHAALALLPDYVAERTEVRRVHDVLIP
jgi:hypothetical protein